MAIGPSTAGSGTGVRMLCMASPSRNMVVLGLALWTATVASLALMNSFHWGEDSDRHDLIVLPPWTPATSPPHVEQSPPAATAVVTQLYSDAYAEGVVMLGYSLRRHGGPLAAKVPLVALYLRNAVSPSALDTVRLAGWVPREVERIAPPGKTLSAFRDQFTKLRLWNMTEYTTVVYVDADCLVLGDITELLTLTSPPGGLAAVGDVWNEFWPWGNHGLERNFNAGVLVLRPSAYVLDDMLRKVNQTHKYDTTYAEQSFLNAYTRLPYRLNFNLAIFQGYPQLWLALRDDIRILHFNLAKPMMSGIPGDLRMDRRPEVEPFVLYSRLFTEMARDRPALVAALGNLVK